MKEANKLSTLKRETYLRSMADRKLDLLVIGGGITGAGIALDAAVRGLSVGLLEKQDFAQGTSSRSTKLIHGGLRYLKQGDVKLVREVGRERAILYRNAPHIVIPEKMLLPIVEKGTYGRLATSFGLWLYDYLAGVRKDERRVMLSKQDTIALEPLLRSDILKGAGLYYEYRTDDARLTIEVLKTAASYGAACVNYAMVTDFLYQDGKVTGVRAADRISGREYRIYASRIVNAAGPWADELRAKDGSLSGKRLHLTKGVHLVVPHEKLPLRQAVYFDVPDGRMVFAIPRDRVTYIGTTDTNYDGDTSRPRATREDAAYLLEAVNHMFPGAKLTLADIASSWAGLRPLIHEDGKSPSELSRKDEIFHSPTGLITIAGGKLTGFRKMAQRIVDLVMKQLAAEEGRAFVPCTTDRIVLAGGHFPSPEAIPAFVRNLADGVEEERIRQLVGKYGTQAEIILEKMKTLAAVSDDPALQMVIAEIHYGVEEEMVTNLRDFLFRRTGRLYFERQTLPALTEPLLAVLAERFAWSPDRTALERQMLEAEYAEAVSFPEEREA
ncbi:glycerol-3-phosphate dehydrogenase/oxidase [Brevibacillus sp. SYP-B805]|uniref:FAD-dependent oxidoreductase n=1 Tax=Brevibacillus sp. SYP-B805 TaxID=1578199 RepID=UPI0013EAA01B|nr:glycerol-3-phosphate dehydrogenase/oxidase [Brevibacillus sp. SYP-B805]